MKLTPGGSTGPARPQLDTFARVTDSDDGRTPPTHDPTGPSAVASRCGAPWSAHPGCRSRRSGDMSATTGWALFDQSRPAQHDADPEQPDGERRDLYHPNASGGLADHVRPNDIFVINTRFQNHAGTSNPAVASQLADRLRQSFPCNRIIALNGLGANQPSRGTCSRSRTPAYMRYCSIGSPTTELARALNPGLPDGPMFPPRDPAGWGLVARTEPDSCRTQPTDQGRPRSPRPPRLELRPPGPDGRRPNRRLGRGNTGPQSVQTQQACMFGPGRFGRRARGLLRSYKFKYVKRKRVRNGKLRRVRVRKKFGRKGRPDARNLALQISFSNTPNPPIPCRCETSPRTLRTLRRRGARARRRRLLLLRLGRVNAAAVRSADGRLAPPRFSRPAAARESANHPLRVRSSRRRAARRWRSSPSAYGRRSGWRSTHE